MLLGVVVEGRRSLCESLQALLGLGIGVQADDGVVQFDELLVVLVIEDENHPDVRVGRGRRGGRVIVRHRYAFQGSEDT